MSNPNNPALRAEYLARINRVVDHIDQNLDRDLSLETLAQIANFSPFHFHRIFRAMIGEPLYQFIQRLRLEKAASKLLSHTDSSITLIALDCGFSSSATFARAFKEAYGMTATEWRKGGFDAFSKNRKTDSKESIDMRNLRKDWQITSIYIADEFNHQKWKIMIDNKIRAEVEVKDLPQKHLAYVRHVGPYQGNESLFESLFNKLMRWAGPRGLIQFPKTEMLSVYHDDPNITDPEKLRLTVAITVPPDTEVDGEVGKMTLAGGKYAIARFEISSNEFSEAWDAVYGGWLPESGYQPTDGPCFELYHNDPKQHPEGKHIFDIGIPVKPL